MMIANPCIDTAILELAEACKTLQAKKGSATAIGSICTGVANLIFGAGTYGGNGQVSLMDTATKCGFTCEFYTGQTIRVSWQIQ